MATDVLALLDAMGLDRVLLVAHDWGAYVGYRMILRAPERFDGYLAMNMAHPWASPRMLAQGLADVVPGAARDVGGAATTAHECHHLAFKVGSTVDPEAARMFAERFRDPVCARAGRDTYRTFLTREIPQAAKNPETRRATVPIRALYGTGDPAVGPAFVDPATANADDYTLETTEASHFVVDERPDLVRKKLIDLAEETAGP